MNLKKTINISLIITVVVIWSVLAYRFFRISEDSVSHDLKTIDLKPTEFSELKNNKQELILTDKQAFGKNNVQRKNLKNNSSGTSKKTIQSNPKIVKPNFVSFHGSITDNSGNTVYIIKINGTIRRMRIGQKINEVSILKSLENGILITDKGVKREVFETN